MNQEREKPISEILRDISDKAHQYLDRCGQIQYRFYQDSYRIVVRKSTRLHPIDGPEPVVEVCPELLTNAGYQQMLEPFCARKLSEALIDCCRCLEIFEADRQSKESESQRVQLDLGYGTLVVEQLDPDYKEVFVYLHYPDGSEQDLAYIGSQYDYDGDSNVVLQPGISVKVWEVPDREEPSATIEIPVKAEKQHPSDSGRRK